MAVDGEYFVHTDPVWRERSNFILNARLPERDAPRKFEQLFTRRVADGRFQLCCIPFALYNVALDDVVTTDDDHVLTRVVESGRYVFRVWLGRSSYPRDQLGRELEELGSLLEWSSPNLLAVDAVDLGHAQTVAGFLAEHKRNGDFIYETGRT